MKFSHAVFEKNPLILLVGVLIVVAIGGIVEIVPLFLINTTIEKVEGMRPYTPLELVGRNVYVREGCYNCHSQMIRALRSEVDRYGHYSLAAESLYDHPFQWGSKRTGPDLARVGGKYSDEWQRLHLENPRQVVPESIMPNYRYLSERTLDTEELTGLLTAHKRTGVPYSREMIDSAKADLALQADPEGDADALAKRYPKVNVRDFDGDPSRVTEMDALIAYLQMLGTLVDVNAAGLEAKVQQ